MEEVLVDTVADPVVDTYRWQRLRAYMDAGLVLAVEILNFSKMLNVWVRQHNSTTWRSWVEDLAATFLLVVSCGVVL